MALYTYSCFLCLKVIVFIIRYVEFIRQLQRMCIKILATRIEIIFPKPHQMHNIEMHAFLISKISFAVDEQAGLDEGNNRDENAKKKRDKG